MSARPTGWVALALALVLLPGGCGGDAAPEGPTLRLWHTFGPEETRALNQTLATLERTQHLRVEPTVVPFGLGRSRVTHALTEARASECPDVARIDATWLPFLAARGLLTPVPASFELSRFTAEARELGRWNDVDVAVPQAVDGLALLYDARRVPGATGVAWPPASLAELEAAARALTTRGRYGLSLRSDGYWFVAWLRAAGADVVDPASGALGVDQPAAEAALAAYAALAAPGGGGVAPPPSPAGDEAALEAERFAAGEVAIVVGGPWTIAALAEAARRRGVEVELAVAPFPRAPDGTAAAPRGGQLYVVPRCAAHAEAAWRLVAALTDARLQAAWSRTLGLIPTRTAALAEASPLARAFARALEATRPLPRHPLTPLVFDDLTPALQAVMAGDASAAEALAGVERAWTRLLARAKAAP
jgi:ABC-type glycerol-3-phosphate transport system substrate-binding protein